MPSDSMVQQTYGGHDNVILVVETGHLTVNITVDWRRTARVGPLFSLLPSFDSSKDGHFSKTPSFLSQRWPSFIERVYSTKGDFICGKHVWWAANTNKSFSN